MKDLQKILKDRRCLVFLDVEATQLSHEMIQLGAYKVLLKDDFTVKKVFKPFNTYVKAKHRIGSVVTQLTGITEAIVAKEGVPFRVAQQSFKKYIGKDYNRCLFVAYGSQDGRIFVTSAENNMDASMDEARYISHHTFDLCDFLYRYVQSESGNPYSLTNCLKVFEVPFDGKAHDALTDAKNLLGLYSAMLSKKDILQAEYKKTLARNGRLPLPVRLMLNELLSGKTVSPDQFDQLIKETLQ